MSQKLRKLQEEVILEQQKSVHANETMHELERKWGLENSRLNKALQDCMQNNENLETNISSLETNLLAASTKVDELLACKDAVETRSTEAATMIARLENELKSERKISEEDRQQLEHERKLREEERQIHENEQKLREKERKQLERERELREKIEKKNNDLEHHLQETLEERDLARDNMLGFNDREEELYHKLRESDRIRREQHNRLMQLMGNIRVFVRVRPPLPGELEDEAQQAAAKFKRKRSEEGDDEEEYDEDTFRFPGFFENRQKKAHATDDVTKNIIEVMAPWEDRGGLKDRRKRHRFGFDHVFAPQHMQKDIWEATEPLIQSAIDGFNVTLFAYGQTGKKYSRVNQ
jgi:Microtubule binding